MNPAEKMWWIKLFSALVVAALTFYLDTYVAVDGLIAFVSGVLAYVGISEILGRSNNMDRSRALKIGWGVFLITWLVAWTLLNTVVAFPF